MRSPFYSVFKKLNDINTEWDRRGVRDATWEPEWDTYEQLLYSCAEFVIGMRT